ncbi:MAG: YchJ family protein [Myxococcaceae bacterium]
MTCPCGSGLPLSGCCGPRHDGSRPAETAEALMRSRYSAFALGNGAYLIATQAPELTHEPAEAVSAWAKGVQWLGLTVLRVQHGRAGDKRGLVEFEARYLEAGKPVTLHEVSRFDRPGGRWRYRGAAKSAVP